MQCLQITFMVYFRVPGEEETTDPPGDSYGKNVLIYFTHRFNIQSIAISTASKMTLFKILTIMRMRLTRLLSYIRHRLSKSKFSKIILGIIFSDLIRLK